MSNLSLASLLKTRQTLVVVLAFGLFAMAARGMLDPDIWWHLRTGQLIVHSHHLFHADPYSFTRSGQPWVNHEWLFDVLAFALFRVAGAGALIFAFALITSSTFLLVFSRCPGRPFRLCASSGNESVQAQYSLVCFRLRRFYFQLCLSPYRFFSCFPSLIVRIWFVETFSSFSVTPPGHRTSMMSALLAPASPKCNRKSL